MARDINKILSQYDVITQETKEPFTLGDMRQIYNKVAEQGKNPSYDTIDTALRYAFVIGYQEAQKKRQGEI